jgi:hypothetical protein
VKIVDGRYYFESRAIFESYVLEMGKLSDKELDDYEQKIKFKSIRYIQNRLEKTEINYLNTLSVNSINPQVNIAEDQLIEQTFIDDPGFAAVLNEEYILQIDDEIFKVNIVDGFVYVMDENNIQYLPQLEDSFLEPDVIYRYQMGLPLLDILEQGAPGIDPVSVDASFGANTVSCIECKSACEREQTFENGVCNGCAGTGPWGDNRKAQPDNRNINITYRKTDGSSTIVKYRIESKISYQPLGVWFSMVSKVKSVYEGWVEVNSNGVSGALNTNTSKKVNFIKIQNKSEYNFRRRCKDRQTGFEDEGNGFSFAEKKEYRFYNGTRCLKDYCIVSKVGYLTNNLQVGGIVDEPTKEWTMTLKSY